MTNGSRGLVSRKKTEWLKEEANPGTPSGGRTSASVKPELAFFSVVVVVVFVDSSLFCQTARRAQRSRRVEVSRRNSRRLLRQWRLSPTELGGGLRGESDVRGKFPSLLKGNDKGKNSHLLDPGDGIERGLHGAAHESQRTPHECGARCGHEDARHAAASHRIPPQHEHRSPVPTGWRFVFLLFKPLNQETWVLLRWRQRYMHF